MVVNYIRGHEFYYDGENWRYKDTNEILNEELDSKLPCTKCGHSPNKDGHDYCLQNLGYVINACCGHGKEEGYIMFNDGTTVRGYFTIERPEDFKEGICYDTEFQGDL